MTDPEWAQQRSPKRPRVALEDLELLVRVRGRPDAIRAYTAAEESEAHTYAHAEGGTVEPLPPSRARL